LADVGLETEQVEASARKLHRGGGEVDGADAVATPGQFAGPQCGPAADIENRRAGRKRKEGLRELAAGKDIAAIEPLVTLEEFLRCRIGVELAGHQRVRFPEAADFVLGGGGGCHRTALSPGLLATARIRVWLPKTRASPNRPRIIVRKAGELTANS